MFDCNKAIIWQEAFNEELRRDWLQDFPHLLLVRDGTWEIEAAPSFVHFALLRFADAAFFTIGGLQQFCLA